MKQFKQKTTENPKRKKETIIKIAIALAIGATVGSIKQSILISLIWFMIAIVVIIIYSLTKIRLNEYNRTKKMENSFPDFLQLVASNLRAGMPTDQALLMSARKEFDPLDKEITKLGKELMTGKEIETAMFDMGQRTHSQRIQRTVNLIVSGIKSGGNIAVLLEETATNARERYFIQKRAESNVLMYVIFVFAAITVGAPGLFGLSTVLVEVLTNVLSTIPEVQTSASLPFTLSRIDLPISFVIYFSVTFLIAIDILGALVLGLVTKGEEKAGAKYIIPVVSVSLGIFFIVRTVLLKYFAEFFNI